MLRTLVDEYVEGRIRRREIGWATGRTYRYALYEWADEMPGLGFTRRDVQRWLAGVDGSIGTVFRKLSHVKVFGDWLVAEGHLDTNPARTVRGPRLPRSVPRALGAGDVRLLLEPASAGLRGLSNEVLREQLMISLMLMEGLRAAEVADLELEHVDLAGGVLRVTGKGGHTRLVPVSSTSTLLLVEWLGRLPRVGAPLVRSLRDMTSGVTPAWVSHSVASAMRRAGVKVSARDGVSAHALRHTCGADVLERTGDLVLVRDLLGHSSVSTTQIYTRNTNVARLRVAVERSYA